MLLKWGVGIAFALAALGGIIYGVGTTLPLKHTAEVARVISATPQQIAARIRAVDAYATWRRGVIVEAIKTTGDAITYVEVSKGDRIALRLTEPERDARFVTTMTDETLPFGGTWTITLSAVASGTQVSIREDGEIRAPIYRFFARFVFGYTSSMDAYISSLAAAASS